MQRLFSQNNSVFRCCTTAGIFIASLFTSWSVNATTSLDFQVPFYSRLSDGTGVVTNRTFNTVTGPSDGLRLLTGMRLVKSGTDGVFIGIDRSTVLRVTSAGEAVNESAAKPELADWSMGVTFDSTAQRVVLVTLGGEGTLYQRTPDGVWSTIASMQNEDLESLVYRAADNSLYGIEVYNGAPTVPATLLKYSATGERVATVPLPAFPVNLAPGDHTAKLIAVEGKIVALVERIPESALQSGDHSRIYVIDPVTGTAELTYDQQAPAVSLKITSPEDGAEFVRGVPIHLTAQAQNGSVTSVTFLSNGLGIGDAVASPPGVEPQTYTYIWSNAPAGSPTLRAFGRTTAGTYIYSETLRIKVLQATNVPTVRFVSPTTNDVIHVGDHVPVKIEVFDADNNIQRIFFESRNGQKTMTFDPPPTGTNVYTFDYVPPFVGNNYLYASVYDGTGLKAATNRIISVLQAPPAPTIAIYSPTQNADYVQGATVPINARGNVAFSNVWIFADGQKIGDAREALITIYPPSYGFAWTNAPAGEHDLIAVGLTGGNTSATSAPVHIIVRAVIPVVTIERDLPDTYTAGTWVNVSIKATPNTLVNAWAVEETPPAGWQFGQASYNGLFDSATGKIKWGPFTDHEPRTLFYTVRPPTNSVGIKTFFGIVSVNGVSKPITGDKMISDSPAHHPADLPPEDNRLTVNEVTAYAAAWKTGTNWPRGPSPIPIDYVTRAGQIWRLGEQYQFNPLLPPPSCWIPANQKTPAIGIAALVAPNVATRTLPPAFTPGRLTTVSVNVRPAAGVQNYALEERPPAGWAIADAEGASITDRALRYGPFYDAQERTFVYHLVPSATATGPFSGEASFDGSKDAIEGNASLTPPTCVAENRDGHVYLHFNATPGETFVLESADSIDSAIWQFEGTVQGADTAIDLPPIVPAGSQKFYRLRPVGP